MKKIICNCGCSRIANNPNANQCKSCGHWYIPSVWSSGGNGTMTLHCARCEGPVSPF